MRYVITYFNITKEKRYCYVIVILNIGSEIAMQPEDPQHYTAVVISGKDGPMNGSTRAAQRIRTTKSTKAT